MDVSTRIRKIEVKVFNRQTYKKMVILEKIDSKYYIDRNGKLEETVPLEKDPNTLYVIEKLYPPIP